MIVAAAVPLVAERGSAVTTSQIARAAGIGEATIFRVFADKDEVIDACLAEAARPDHVLRELADIPRDQSLEARLSEALRTMRAHLDRMGSVIGALAASGHRRPGTESRKPGAESESGAESRKPGAESHGPGAGNRGQHRPGDREASMRAVREALTDLIEPDRESMRFTPPQVAAALLGLLFGQARGTESSLSDEELVDIVLHGAAKPLSGG
jgi:AcrR family transcriptional regulator